MSIRILVTGGTFDKEYNERTGQLFFKDTHVAEMLRLGRSRVEITIHTVMMIAFRRSEGRRADLSGSNGSVAGRRPGAT